jgi:hypothetical protein
MNQELEKLQMADDLAGRAAHRDRCRDRHCRFMELGRDVIGQMF